MTNVLREQFERVPEDVRARILLAGHLAHYDRDTDEAIRHLQTAVALRPGDPNTLYNAACAYGILGKKAEALATIKNTFAAGYRNREWAANDLDLECLLDDPEFRKLVASTNFLPRKILRRHFCASFNLASLVISPRTSL